MNRNIFKNLSLKVLIILNIIDHESKNELSIFNVYFTKTKIQLKYKN